MDPVSVTLAIAALLGGIACLALAVKLRLRSAKQSPVTPANLAVPAAKKKKQQKRGQERTASTQAQLPTVAMSESSRNSRRVNVLLAMAACLIAHSGYLLYLGATMPRTDEEKVARHMANVLRNDADARISRPTDTESGPEDKPGALDARKELSGSQLRDAERILTALTESRLDDLQSVIVQYRDKPLALSEIAGALHYVSEKLGAGLVFYTHRGWFYIGLKTHAEGDCELVIPAAQERAEVLRWTNENGRMQPVRTEELLPRMALKRHQTSLMKTMLHKMTPQSRPAPTLQ